jgi:hypothetical protein
MLFEVKIRLTRHMLGQQRTTDGVRRFTRVRSDDNRISLDLQHWSWAFREAASSLHLPVNISTLYPAAGIAVPTLVMYTRRWSTKTADGRERPQSEMFEAIREGTVLTFQIVSSAGPEKQDGPAADPEQIKALLNFIGEYIGISQWGNKYGYGRFRVESLRAL